VAMAEGVWSGECGAVLYLFESVIHLPLIQDLFAICSYYVTVFNIIAIFCNRKVFKMINCKGFSADCKAVLLLPLHRMYPEICSYAWIVM